MYLRQAIESIINQSLDFEDNIQIIVVNDGSVDNTEDICLKYKVEYPQNFKYVSTKKCFGSSHARNIGLNEAKGKYINFLDSDDYISRSTFKKVLNFFEKHYDEVDLVSIPIYYFGAKKGAHPLNFKFKKSRVIDLLKEPKNIQLSAPSSFIKAEAIGDLRFDENLKTSEDALFINEILLNRLKIGVVSGAEYHYRKFEAKNSLLDYSTNTKTFYTSRVEHFYFKLLNESKYKYGRILKFVQYVIMYDLQWVFMVKAVDNILSEREISVLFKNLIIILQNIDDTVIINQKNISNQLKAHILFLKYLKDEYINLSNVWGDKKRLIRDILTDDLELNQIFIDIYEIRNDMIYISGVLTTFFNEKGSIFVEANNKFYECKKLQYPQRDKYSLNFKYGYNNNFEVYIPITSKITHIKFKSNFPDFHNLLIEFNRPCRLSNTSKYLLSREYVSRVKYNEITVKPRNFQRVFKNEILTLTSMLREKKQGWKTGVLLRLIYFILLPFFASKRIWIALFG